jgi:aspartate aminotransferase
MYDRLVYGKAESVSLCPWWERYPENFVIVNGVSKTFSMTGWRVGFALGHPGLIKAMSSLQGQSTSNVCPISQKAALAALTGGYAETEIMRAAFERRRDLALGIIASWPDVLCAKPDGAFYLFPDMHRLFTNKVPDSVSLCTRFLEKAGVAVVPGAAFGDDRCSRISYAVGDEILAEALRRMAEVLFAK